MSINNKKPEAADIHIGKRVQERRKQVGLSQEKLGEHLGITFQQVQKYEKGANRIGAGRLFSISEVLKTPIGYFFEGLEGKPLGAIAGFSENEEQPGLTGAPGGADDTADLVREFERISDPSVRSTILDLVHALSVRGKGTSGGRTRR